MSNNILAGIMGLSVADALGVPVEFVDRKTLKNNPVVGVRAYGTYNQPAGTWSDDSSMTLCLLDSLANGIDYTDIMNNFQKWFDKGLYTPHGEAFDIGISTRKALKRFAAGTNPLDCGGTTELDNGNGSLMRILPAVFYLQSSYGDKELDEAAFDIIHNISALTHAHKRSKIACGIYLSIALNLENGKELKQAVDQGLYAAANYYKTDAEFTDELQYFNRLTRKDFDELPEKLIKSSGYVVDTLEASIWCLLTTTSYKECILKAVNLGEDTDTVAAVAGGLAGLCYGYESIPDEWLAALEKRDYIESICDKFSVSLKKTDIEKLCNYIPYFEVATKESVCEWSGGEKQEENVYTMPYPVYEKTLKEFIGAVYSTNLMHHDYVKATEELAIENSQELMNIIETANFDTLRAILTNYVRQERFSDGLWANATGEKTFLQILKRFQQLSSA
ncbi:ADP-ribosylglycohydrolase family protein [Virgibacillus sp. DJP39]|uniref:ADP-ribosylglycohydrolase family protein n=1 Tax=Virgibacillus sp. DJP39 TaxID=3409790 RepID=UPI003BB72BC9